MNEKKHIGESEGSKRERERERERERWLAMCQSLGGKEI